MSLLLFWNQATEPIESSLTLVLFGHDVAQQTATLYVAGRDQASLGCGLFVGGKDAVNGAADLTLAGYIVQVGGCPLFIENREDLQGSIPLLMSHAYGVATGQLGLFVATNPDNTLAMTRYIKPREVQELRLKFPRDHHHVIPVYRQKRYVKPTDAPPRYVALDREQRLGGDALVFDLRFERE
ncbi:MAG: hypothetical protein K2R98_19515 [Gemmataceae bacterium]|nr:hypothetical protein [Gemmataceae bacterium]